MPGNDFTAELTGSREDVAAVLNGLADGVLAGSIRLGEGDEAVTVDAPEEFSVELELSADAKDVELEVELEWPTPEDGPGISPTAEDRGDGVEGAADAEGAAAAGGDEDATGTEQTAADDAAEPPAGGSEPATSSAGEPATDEQAADTLAGAETPVSSLARFEVFQDSGEEWRWRLRHRNGNVIATSGEGYTRKHNAWKGLRSVMENAPEAAVREESTD